MNAPRPLLRARAAGFTLLELMIVLLIIAILGAAFMMVSGQALGDARKSEAQARLHTLATMIESYRTIEGEYPNDRLPQDAAANADNAGSEALFLALFHPDYTGERPDQSWLVNTDRDRSARPLTTLGSRELFEIADPWDNPIAYFESLHYGEGSATSMYATYEGGLDPVEQFVEPLRNERTGAFFRENGFQLISAGPDGEFLTEDDITDFER